MHIKLTVFFEEPFWVGVFERVSGNLLETCKVIFGGEPKDYEIYDFVLKKGNSLRFSRPVAVEAGESGKINPKRLQRKIRRETASQGVGTKAQQAMKLEHEACKVERKKLSKEMKEELETLKFQKRQEKKKEKKKGH